MDEVRDPRFLERMQAASEGLYLDECWPWKHTRSRQGYGVITFGTTQYRVGRLILGALPGEQVLHTCDNPPCANPAHLPRGTIQETQWDKGQEGRAARGELNRGGGKLTEDSVRAIRLRLDDGSNPTLVQVGKEFGVSSTLIAKIRDKKL